jgi:hypothetical protein
MRDPTRRLHGILAWAALFGLNCGRSLYYLSQTSLKFAVETRKQLRAEREAAPMQPEAGNNN